MAFSRKITFFFREIKNKNIEKKKKMKTETPGSKKISNATRYRQVESEERSVIPLIRVC